MTRAFTQISTAVIPPTAGAAAESLLASCDPTIAGLLPAFKAILNTKLNAAWQAACQGLSTNVVESTYAYNPIPEEARRTWKWPCLAMWRGASRYSDRTLEFDGQETELHCIYALPPMTQEFFARLSYIRVAVARTLRAFIEQHGDASYLSGADFVVALNLDRLELVETEEGDAFEGQNNAMVQPALRLLFIVAEREIPYTTDIVTATDIATQIDLEDLESVVEMSYDPRT